jgi:hypothetical protein
MKKIVSAVIVLLIVLGCLLYSHLGGTIRSVIESAGTRALGTPVHVGAVVTSLAAKTASISSITIENPPGFKGSLAEAKSVSATLESLESKTITIKEIVVDGLTVTYDVGTAGTNFDVLKKKLKSATPPPSPAEKVQTEGYKLAIQQLRIVNAKVVASIPGNEKTITLPEIIVRNIGSKNQPATPEQVAKQVMEHVLAVSAGATAKFSLKSLPGSINVDKVKDKLDGLLPR